MIVVSHLCQFTPGYFTLYYIIYLDPQVPSAIVSIRSSSWVDCLYIQTTSSLGIPKMVLMIYCTWGNFGYPKLRMTFRQSFEFIFLCCPRLETQPPSREQDNTFLVFIPKMSGFLRSQPSQFILDVYWVFLRQHMYPILHPLQKKIVRIYPHQTGKRLSCAKLAIESVYQVIFQTKMHTIWKLAKLWIITILNR